MYAVWIDTMRPKRPTHFIYFSCAS